MLPVIRSCALIILIYFGLKLTQCNGTYVNSTLGRPTNSNALQPRHVNSPSRSSDQSFWHHHCDRHSAFNQRSSEHDPSDLSREREVQDHRYFVWRAATESQIDLGGAVHSLLQSSTAIPTPAQEQAMAVVRERVTELRAALQRHNTSGSLVNFTCLDTESLQSFLEDLVGGYVTIEMVMEEQDKNPVTAPESSRLHSRLRTMLRKHYVDAICYTRAILLDEIGNFTLRVTVENRRRNARQHYLNHTSNATMTRESYAYTELNMVFESLNVVSDKMEDCALPS